MTATATKNGPVKPAASGGTTIKLPPMNIQTIKVELVGDSPLICHRWSEKAKKAMLAKQMGEARAAKEKKDPMRDFWDSLYHLTPNPPAEHREGQRYGFPAVAFKSAAVTACSSVEGITKVAARQAFHVGAAEGGDLIEIIGVPEIREDMVRIGMGVADIRYRASFRDWRATLYVKHNANLLTAAELVNLFNTAGFSVGIGEWRVERDGSFGMFHVE